MTSPAVSFILPCYNASGVVGRALNSILRQGLDSFEIVCVDDCSTDNTHDYLEAYSRKVHPIRIVSHDVNRNLGAARNTGLDAAQGEFVYFLDADDWLSDSGVSRLLQIALQREADVVACGVQMVQEDGRVTPYHAWTFESRGGSEGVEYFSHYKIGAIAWNKLYRRRLLLDKDIRFIEKYYHEDILFTARIALECNRYVSIDDVFMNYFQSSSSICNSIPGRRHLASYVNLYVEMSKFFEMLAARGVEDPELLRRVARNYGSSEVFPKLERYASTRSRSQFLDEAYAAAIEVLGPGGAGVADLIFAAFTKFSPAE